MQKIQYKENNLEDLMFDILDKMNLNPVKEVRDNSGRLWDIVCYHGDKTFFVETKFYRRKYIGTQLLKELLKQLNAYDTGKQKAEKVLVVSSEIEEKAYDDLKSELQNIVVLDIRNLLYLVNENNRLKERLLSYIEYAVDDINITSPASCFAMAVPKEEDDDIQKLISELEAWDPKIKTEKEYEEICVKTLKKLFVDNLCLWKEQACTKDMLFRFDLICRIKDDKVSPFWKLLESFFNSKYIVFEFKNYSNPITQREIYTTEKYLYAVALRKVSIIIAASGSSDNAFKAAEGILREDGKLILLLSNKDLIKMLKKKDRKEDPSDYIYDKLDDVLTKLEK